MQTYDAVATAFGHEPNQHLRETFGRIAEKYLAFLDCIGALNTLRSDGFVRGVLSYIDDALFKRAMIAAGTSFDVVVTPERVGV